MTERIKQLIDHYRLSQSDFASQIGAQRAAVSHIISGRNKPGLDLIQKILGAFPEVNADWFIMGKGNMLRKDNSVTGNENVNPPDLTTVSGTQTEIPSEPERPAPYSAKQEEKAAIRDKKNHRTVSEETPPVEKVIILYSDNTFREYGPKGQD